MHDLSEIEAIERIGLSLLAGFLLGFEREWHDKPAGLRTYALVCEGSALFMIASLLLGNQVRAGGESYDPSRIGSTIVQGVGFIAGGIIFTQGVRVKGLTTAAGVWVASAIGLLIGAGFYIVAYVGVVATVVTLVVMHRVEVRIRSIEAAKNTPELSSDSSGPSGGRDSAD